MTSRKIESFNKQFGLDGLETAKFLSNQHINSTIFFHMGEGIFNSLQESGMKVYSCVKNYLSIDEIYRQFLSNKCKILILITTIEEVFFLIKFFNL